MSKYRNFKIIKGNTTLDLMGEELFLYSPSGLGMQNAFQYLDMGGYFSEYSRNISQMQPNGTFIFTPDSEPYAKYQEVMNFILGADNLILGYQPKELDWYYARVNIVSADKTELNDAGILEVPVVFDMLSAWYLDSELEYSTGSYTGDNVYPYTYSDTYPTDIDAGVITVTPNAQMDCDWTIRVKGTATNPVIKVYTDGELVGVVDLTGLTLEAGQELIFTTIPTQDLLKTAGAYLYTGGTYTNISTQIIPNPNYPAFKQIAGGYDTKFALNTGDIYGLPEFSVKVRQYYRTV